MGGAFLVLTFDFATLPAYRSMMPFGEPGREREEHEEMALLWIAGLVAALTAYASTAFLCGTSAGMRKTQRLTPLPATAGWQAPVRWCCHIQGPWDTYELLRLPF